MTSRVTVGYYRYHDNNVIIAIIELSLLSHSPSVHILNNYVLNYSYKYLRTF